MIARLFPWLAGAALVFAISPVARASIAIALEDAPGTVLLPNNWRPIPRAEIVESRERAALATDGKPLPLPAAAFQQLPTLQWFTLPHALVFWHPAVRDAAAGSPQEQFGTTPAPAQHPATLPVPAEATAAPAVPGTGSAADEAPAMPDVQVRETQGRGPHNAIVHVWSATITRPDGYFTLDLFTRDEDGRALLLGLAAGLRAVP